MEDREAVDGLYNTGFVNSLSEYVEKLASVPDIKDIPTYETENVPVKEAAGKIKAFLDAAKGVGKKGMEYGKKGLEKGKAFAKKHPKKSVAGGIAAAGGVGYLAGGRKKSASLWDYVEPSESTEE